MRLGYFSYFFYIRRTAHLARGGVEEAYHALSSPLLDMQPIKVAVRVYDHIGHVNFVSGTAVVLVEYLVVGAQRGDDLQHPPQVRQPFPDQKRGPPQPRSVGSSSGL